MRKLYFTLLAILPLFSLSCNHNKNKTVINSGRIDYKITYIDHHLNEKNLELMPRNMKLVFNKKQATNFIEGFMGFYKLNTYTDFHARSCSTLLKVFDKYYIFEGRKDEMMCCFDEMNDMELTETNETKVIAGFNCKKLIVRVPSFSEPITVYYTDEIDLKHPNITNPYKMINGVLMEFEMKLLDIHMRFTAEKYQPLPDNKIENVFPKKTKEVSRVQMARLMERLLEF